MVDVVVGRFPPPLGGVTVFVQRKFDSLRASGALKVDFGNRYWILDLLRFSFSKENRYLLNSGNLVVLSVFYILGLLSRTILYDHNSSRHVWKSRIQSVLYGYFVRQLSEVRVVHAHLIEGYRDRGLERNVTVESPFLPPDTERRDEVISTYPEDVKCFMRGSGFIRVVNAASKYNVDAEGREIYGIEATLDLLETARAGGLNVRVLLAGHVRGDAVPKELLSRMDKLQAAGVLFLLGGDRELWPVLEVSDVLLRLTSTDGESVSVKEGLHFGCKVICSDIVPRPFGVFKYKYGDSEDLLAVFLDLTRSV